MLFRDSCVDKGRFYAIALEMSDQPLTHDNVQSLYDYLAMIRKLPKDFVFTLDMRRAPLLSYIAFLYDISREAGKEGQSKCIGTDVVLLDSKPLALMLPSIVGLFQPLTPIPLQIRCV